MEISIRIAPWNAYDISRNLNEHELSLKTKRFCICIISETQMNSKLHFKIRGHDLITANHPYAKFQTCLSREPL